MQTIAGIFVVLHGLVHMWYVTLSQGWVKFQPNMGWTGKSWLLSNWIKNDPTLGNATVFYALATILYLVSGIGILANQDWSRPWIISASVISALTILVFWDGNFSMLIQKGVLGFLISGGILVIALVFKWPAI